MKNHSFTIPLLILVLFSVTLTSCGNLPVSPTLTPTLAPPSQTPPPTETPSPTPIPTFSEEQLSQQAEQEYAKTIIDEQKRAEYTNAVDMTAEGLRKEYLSGDLSNYLAYFDNKGEVAYVWNPEQNKINPALLSGNTLFVNETSSSKMVWNKDHPAMSVEKQKEVFLQYMDYVRANACALSKGVNLPNTLPEAINDPNAQDYLNNGCDIVLRKMKGTRPGGFKYDIPEQNIHVDRNIGIVIKTVQDRNPNIYPTGTAEGFFGISFEKPIDGPLIASYYNDGSEYIVQFAEFKHMLLAERISKVIYNLFYRVNLNRDLDTTTETTIYNQVNGETQPPFVYSQ